MEEDEELLYVRQKLEREMEEAFQDSKSKDELVQYEDDDTELESRDGTFGDEEQLAQPQPHIIRPSIPIEQQTGSLTFQDLIPFISNIEVGNGYLSFNEDIHQTMSLHLGNDSNSLLRIDEV